MKKEKQPTEKISLKQRLKTLCDLFITFFKIGIVCFGGGYAMIAIIEQEVVEKRKWLTSEEMLDIIAIAESTPGPISMNVSTYVGTKQCGFLGALASTFGAMCPSFIIIFAISFFIEQFKSLTYVGYAFKGIRVAVLVLIFNATFKMFKKLEKSIFAICVILFTLSMCIFTDLGAIYVLLICAACGLIYNFVVRAVKNKKNPKAAEQPAEGEESATDDADEQSKNKVTTNGKDEKSENYINSGADENTADTSKSNEENASEITTDGENVKAENNATDGESRKTGQEVDK